MQLLLGKLGRGCQQVVRKVAADRGAGLSDQLGRRAKSFVRLRTWIAERWEVTIKSVDDGDGKNNREAVAWFDETSVYIPKDTLREAAGGALRGSEVASILARRGLLTKRTEADLRIPTKSPGRSEMMSPGITR
jgi:hypothetical protein